MYFSTYQLETLKRSSFAWAVTSQAKISFSEQTECCCQQLIETLPNTCHTLKPYWTIVKHACTMHRARSGHASSLSTITTGEKNIFWELFVSKSLQNCNENSVLIRISVRDPVSYIFSIFHQNSDSIPTVRFRFSARQPLY